MSDAHDCRNKAHDPQAAVRHVEGCGHRAFGAEREGRKQNAFDREEQADRGQEIEHRSEVRLIESLALAALARADGVGAGELAAAPGGGCPDGLEK